MTHVPAGSTVTVNNGSGGAHQSLGELISMDGVAAKAFKQVKATHSTSSVGDRVPGLPMFGPMKFTLKYTRDGFAQASALNGQDPGSGATKGFTYRYTEVQGDRFDCRGWMVSMSGVKNEEAESETCLAFDVEIFVRAVTYVAGASAET